MFDVAEDFISVQHSATAWSRVQDLEGMIYRANNLVEGSGFRGYDIQGQ